MGIPDIPEKELLGGCVRGDKEAWNTLILKYSRLVWHSLYQTLKYKNPPIQAETIEELHQDVFLSLMEDDYKKLRQFKGKNGCSLANWIRVIAVRKAIDHLRRQAPTVSIGGNPGNCENLAEVPDEGANPEQDMIRSQEIEIIAEVIRRLPSRYQFFIDLFYRRDLSIEEISQIMKLDPNAVYQLHRRIKEKMREILSNDYLDIAAA